MTLQILFLGTHGVSDKSRLRKRRGFSLVEVTLAMGIISFSMLTMLALLPVGLTSLRESRENILHSQIASRISSDLQQLPFDEISTYTGSSGSPVVHYFDESGIAMASQGSDALYEVTCESTIRNFYPGADLAANLSNNVAIVELTIKHSARPTEIGKYVIHVANLGG